MGIMASHRGLTLASFGGDDFSGMIVVDLDYQLAFTMYQKAVNAKPFQRTSCRNR